jgi:hypothetical protein
MKTQHQNFFPKRIDALHRNKQGLVHLLHLLPTEYLSDALLKGNAKNPQNCS